MGDTTSTTNNIIMNAPPSTVTPSAIAAPSVNSGVNTGTTAAATSGSPPSSAQATALPGTPAASGAGDLRVRLSAQSDTVYGGNAPGNLLTPLIATNGMIFPYSPSLTFQQDVNYQEMTMVHTNMDWLGYTRTPSVSLTIIGKFTVQSNQEGLYALAALHFCRVVSKMYFGQQAGSNAGLPPPVLLLNGYGTYMFNNLRCVLKSHSWSYDPQIDTVPVTVNNTVTRLPSMFDLTIMITVQQTPTKMLTEFNLDTFRTGALIASKGGWI